MNNDKGLLSGSITILIGAVIAIMALVRGPWQVWLLLGVFTLWGLWVVLILLLPYMQQAQRRRQRQQRTRQLHAEGIQTRSFEIPDLGGTNSDDLLVRHTNHRILAYLRSAYPQATFEWCEKQPEQLIRNGGTGRIRVFGIDEFDHADVTLDQNANIKCDMVKIVPLSKVGGETNEDDVTPPNRQPVDPRIWYETQGRSVLEGRKALDEHSPTVTELALSILNRIFQDIDRDCSRCEFEALSPEEQLAELKRAEESRQAWKQYIASLKEMVGTAAAQE